MKCRRQILPCLGLLGLLAVTLGSPVEAQPFVYVSNNGSNSVSAFTINADGSLTPVPGSPFPNGGGGIEVNPSGQCLYVTGRVIPTQFLYADAINANGSLTPVSASPVATNSFGVTVDPSGRFVYVANRGGTNGVSGFTINANCSVTPVPGSPFSTGAIPAIVAVNPLDQFVYVTNSGSNNVSGYTLNSNGSLTPLAGSPFPAGTNPGGLAVDPTGQFAYVANAGNNNVSAYAINANGSLTPVPGSPFPSVATPVKVAITSAGQFAYVPNLDSNNVSGFSINRDGSLTPVPGSPFPTGSINPGSVAVDPTDQFVYVTNFAFGRNVSGFSINRDGSLTPVPGSPFPAGNAAAEVAVTPSRPAQVAVPNVGGLTQAAATTAITNAGLVVGTLTTASSNTVPAGKVISQNPVAATMVNQGSAVNLVVSTGVPPTVLSFNVLFGSQSYNVSTSARHRLPWQITGIRVVFSKSIATGGAASLGGVTVTGFTGLGTNTLTWSIAPVPQGNLAPVLSGSGPTALLDAAGNSLAGGAGFTQALKILWGDFNDDGVVSAADLVGVNNATIAPYNVFADMNGDGVVTIADVQIVRTRVGTSLP